MKRVAVLVRAWRLPSSSPARRRRGHRRPSLTHRRVVAVRVRLRLDALLRAGGLELRQLHGHGRRHRRLRASTASPFRPCSAPTRAPTRRAPCSHTYSWTVELDRASGRRRSTSRTATLDVDTASFTVTHDTTGPVRPVGRALRRARLLDPVRAADARRRVGRRRGPRQLVGRGRARLGLALRTGRAVRSARTRRSPCSSGADTTVGDAATATATATRSPTTSATSRRRRPRPRTRRSTRPRRPSPTRRRPSSPAQSDQYWSSSSDTLWFRAGRRRLVHPERDRDRLGVRHRPGRLPGRLGHVGLVGLDRRHRHQLAVRLAGAVHVDGRRRSPGAQAGDGDERQRGDGERHDHDQRRLGCSDRPDGRALRRAVVRGAVRPAHACGAAPTPAPAWTRRGALSSARRRRSATEPAERSATSRPSPWSAAPTRASTSGNCYRYQYKSTDNVGNVSTASAASADAKVDATAADRAELRLQRPGRTRPRSGTSSTTARARGRPSLSPPHPPTPSPGSPRARSRRSRVHRRRLRREPHVLGRERAGALRRRR